MTKLLIWEIAERLGLKRFIPSEWGYLGPREADWHPRPTPWLFRDGTIVDRAMTKLSKGRTR